jgi:hypothetical protein
MATKNNPGKFDYYERAGPDEQMFVLLDRDPIAPFLVSIWASVRMGDAEAARVKFETLLTRVAVRYCAEPDVEKASEALDCALEMFRAQHERA